MAAPIDDDLVSHLARMRRERPDRRIVTLPDGSATWSVLAARAAASAARLRAGGALPGEPLAIMRGPSLDLLADFLGAILLGAIPTVLAPPNPRMGRDVFERKLRGILGAVAGGAAPLAAVDDDAAADSVRRAGARVVAPGADGAPAATDPTPWLAPRDPDAALFLQHSSGTTGTPKGVVVTHRMLVDHLRAYGAALGVGADDRIASWLPWYHDMGMVAALWGSLGWDVPSIHLSNFAWVLEPASLLREATAMRATFVWMPNFAFALLARAPLALDPAVDLSSVRRWINCAEPIQPEAVAAFARRFAAHGVRAESIVGCYGMAENVFAVSQAEPGDAATLRVDRRALEVDGRVVGARGDAPARAIASCGRPVAGTEVAVRDAAGAVSAVEDTVGELLVRGRWRFRGYHGRAAETAAALDGDWYRTGDLGFLHGGAVYVVGRIKDLVVVGGRKLDPAEAEAAAETVDGVIAGRVCCVGVDDEDSGTQQAHLVVESAAPPERHAAVAAAVKAAVRRDTDFPLRQVWCVPPRWLIKSSSGKIARREVREKLLAQLLAAAH